MKICPELGTRLQRGKRQSMSVAGGAAAGALLACAIVSCTTPEAPADDPAWVGTITTEGDVTTVINESGSVWGGTATLVEEASIGVDVGDEPYMLGFVSGITATEDRIYVLDESPAKVRVYDMDGRHLMDVGREGQGPGELNQVGSIGIHPGGKLLVRSDGNARMNVFSLDGEFLDDWPLPSGYVTSFPMMMMHDGTVRTRLPVGGDIDGTGMPQRGMVGFDIEGNPVGDPILTTDTLAVMTLGEVAGVSSSGRRVRRTMTVPFSPTTPSILSPAGAVVAGVGDAYRFEIRQVGGGTIVVERRTDPVAVLPDEADWYRRFVYAQAKDLDASWSWSGPDIPPHKPYFGGFFVDQGGRVWVRRAGPGRHLADCDEDPEPGTAGSIARCWEDTRIMDVFDRDGRFLGNVELPEGARLRAGRSFVRDDLVLLRVEDEAGTIMVKRYRLVLPPEREAGAS